MPLKQTTEDPLFATGRNRSKSTGPEIYREEFTFCAGSGKRFWKIADASRSLA
jgi:hypothetical protein